MNGKEIVERYSELTSKIHEKYFDLFRLVASSGNVKALEQLLDLKHEYVTYQIAFGEEREQLESLENGK